MKKTASGIIKLKGWSFHFDLDDGKMIVKTGIPRRPTDEERAAIADAIKHLNITLSILSERVDMTEEAEANGCIDPLDILIPADERKLFEDFVKDFAKGFEERDKKKSSDPFDDLFKRQR